MLLFKPFTCTKCGMYLHCFDRMKQHVRRHKLRYRCISRNLKYMHRPTTNKNNIVQKSMQTRSKDGTYRCEICQKCFSQQCLLIGHIRTRIKEEPYQCEYCQKCFSLRSEMNLHIRTHTKEKLYQCDCQKCFLHLIWPERSFQDSHQRETMSIRELSEMFFTAR